MPWFKIVRAFFIVFTWSKSALKDGKITLPEAFDLILKLAQLLGLPTEFATKELQDVIKGLPTIPGLNKEDTS